jgi:hypothetical protein
MACTDEPLARRVLADQGYTDVVLTGYDPWMCGRDDDYSTGFRATSQSGAKVSGAVCSAFLTKGATIRFK